MSERERTVWPPPRRGIRDCASWVGIAAGVGVHAPRLEDAVEDAILVVAMLQGEYDALIAASEEWEDVRPVAVEHATEVQRRLDEAQAAVDFLIGFVQR